MESVVPTLILFNSAPTRAQGNATNEENMRRSNSDDEQAISGLPVLAAKIMLNVLA